MGFTTALVAQQGDSHSFVINRWWAALIASAAVVLLLVLAHLLIVKTVAGESSDPVKKRRRGVKALVIGADGRASTSKLQVVLWFVAVFFAFTFMFAWGRSSNCGDDDIAGGPRCRTAEQAREAFRELVNNELQPEYYVLLGFPVAAAVAAKALTVNKIASGALTKPSVAVVAGGGGSPPTEPPAGVGRGLAEIVSNDRGDADLLDFQYFGFNLLTLAFFWVEFLTHPASGLPNLPPTLIALAGVSAAAYTTKKALETDVRAAITRVIPDPFPGTVGKKITIVGTGFGSAPADAAPPAPSATHYVLLNGERLDVEPSGWTDRAIDAVLNTAAVAAIAGASSAKVVVVDGSGHETEPHPVAVST